MQNIFNYFHQITQIPHCSHHTEKLKNFLINFAKKRGYDVEIDKTDNILIKKGTPKLALQAHYDMVCVGLTPKIETFIKDGWMMAKDSTLGADNGIAVAIMMSLMDEKKDCEFIITSDEEVGLIGASNLEFDLASKYMLNLDSEDDGKVYIGCAGGIDIEATKKYKVKKCSGDFYEIVISGLDGGHSGVEIHKNITNAIKLFGEFLKDKDIKISKIEGGERINSIPVNLKAIIKCDENIESSQHILVNKISGNYEIADNEIIEIIDKFENGVLSFNGDLDIPYESINLAFISFKEGNLKIQTSARAMDDKALIGIQNRYTDFFQNYGCDTQCEGKYPAWKPEINIFSKEIESAMISEFGKSEFKAIHAGLECAIISEKYPNMKFASIGPNIRSPHSIYERVEIISVQKIYQVVKKVIKNYEK